MSHYLKKNRGLTLIEVLIALAIISIAMTAIIKATGQTIRSTAYLQDKTIALWTGEYMLNQARIGLLVSEEEAQSITMLGKQWDVKLTEHETPNVHIKRLTVSVYPHPHDVEASSLIDLESYRYHAE